MLGAKVVTQWWALKNQGLLQSEYPHISVPCDLKGTRRDFSAHKFWGIMTAVGKGSEGLRLLRDVAESLTAYYQSVDNDDDSYPRGKLKTWSHRDGTGRFGGVGWNCPKTLKENPLWNDSNEPVEMCLVESINDNVARQAHHRVLLNQEDPRVEHAFPFMLCNCKGGDCVQASFDTSHIDGLATAFF